MKNLPAFLIILVFLHISCKRGASKDSNALSKVDTTKFFQIKQYLQSQINEVNSTPFFIYKIEITNNHKDSLPISTAAFNKISNQFLFPDINEPGIKNYYTESIFEDQTTKSFTISYTTTNKKLELQNVAVLFDEDGQTVKRIFIRKFYNYTDSSTIEQLSWKPNESLQVNSSTQKADQSETSHQIIVVWNKKDL